MDLDSNTWGPRFWFTLHTMALTYPQHPNAVIKKKYYDFIQNLPAFLPNKVSAENFAQLLDLYPITPYLDSRTSLIQWMHFIHNKINEMLEKPKITMEEFYVNYYKEYKPKQTKMEEYQKWKGKLIYFAVLLGIVGVIYWIY
jgi:hypothetical protein